ncbi:MAG: ketoacyl-ACP synthase III [Ottowia sp.]|nr:ketoacyl-ACP synthase III [Ottowia sp.]
MTLYAKITGTGSVLPPRRVSNQELTLELASLGIETSDEWIVSRSGISFRHFACAETLTSDLATQAAQRALTAAQLDPQKIDLIIVATSTPDHLGGFPSTACVVQEKLGIHNNCAAFDLQAVCSGFIYALSVADKFIRAGMHQHVLVIGAEIFSRILNFKDRGTCVLFGDGAGAVVLSAHKEPGLLATTLHADGRYRNILCVPGSVGAGALQGQAFLHMDGPAVFKFAVHVLDKVAQEVLTLAGLDTQAIDWLIPHQANLRIMQSTAKKLGVPPEKMIITVDQHGNTSAASIPLALDSAVRDGRVKAGQHVLLEGVGGGFTWGAALLRM